MSRKLLSQFAICVAIYLAACVFLYYFQRAFIYFPQNEYQSPSMIGAHAELQEIDVTTDDGLTLHAWYAKPGRRQQTVIFFHGNGDSLMSIAGVADPFIRAGYGVLLSEYRGYSRNPGLPSETGLYSDGRAAFTYLHDQGTEDSDIILFGYSLGTGVAVQMAVDHPDVRALALLAPYTSVVDVAQDRFKIFPAALIVHDRFDNNAKITNVRCPILIANGEKDELIDPELGKILYAHAGPDKTFKSYPEGTHVNLLDDMTALMVGWLESLENQPASPRS